MTLTPATRNGILPMPRRAYSYLRVSDDHQVKGDGLRRQNDFAATLCAEEGWCLDDTLRFEDHGVSGFHGDNARVGQLSRFLDLVKARRIAPGSVLIVECIDRLSREQVPEAYDLFRSILPPESGSPPANPAESTAPTTTATSSPSSSRSSSWPAPTRRAKSRACALAPPGPRSVTPPAVPRFPTANAAPPGSSTRPPATALSPTPPTPSAPSSAWPVRDSAPAASSLGSDPGPTFIPHSAPSPSGRASTSAAFSAAARPSANTSPAAAPNASPCPAASASATHYRTTTPPPSPPRSGARQRREGRPPPGRRPPRL